MTEDVKLRPEEERLRALLRRADALGFARDAVLREEWVHAETKAQILEALETMKGEAEENFRRYRTELGIVGLSA